MYSMNVHRNQKHIDQNAHLQILIQTQTYSNLTLPNLWSVTNVTFVTYYGFKKDEVAKQLECWHVNLKIGGLSLSLAR